MALKSTIHKVELQIADLDRHVYTDHSLRVARHPSETEERLMIRIVAFALFSHERLEVGPGLSDAAEPDLWQRDLTGAIERWIEIGQPDERRVARACGRSNAMVVIAYGRAAALWWKEIAASLDRQRQLTVLQLIDDGDPPIGVYAQRAMKLSMTVQEGSILIADESRSSSYEIRKLK